VTTGTNENPAYALLTLDAATMLPLNWEFYVLDIERANKKGEAVWEMMFDYVDNYKMGHMSPDTLFTLATQVRDDKNVAKNFIWDESRRVAKPSVVSTGTQHAEFCMLT